MDWTSKRLLALVWTGALIVLVRINEAYSWGTLFHDAYAGRGKVMDLAIAVMRWPPLLPTLWFFSIALLFWSDIKDFWREKRGPNIRIWLARRPHELRLGNTRDSASGDLQIWLPVVMLENREPEAVRLYFSLEIGLKRGSQIPGPLLLQAEGTNLSAIEGPHNPAMLESSGWCLSTPVRLDSGGKTDGYLWFRIGNTLYHKLDGYFRYMDAKQMRLVVRDSASNKERSIDLSRLKHVSRYPKYDASGRSQ